MALARDGDKACDAADSTGNADRAYSDFAYVYRRIAGGILACAYDCDLIAVLGTGKVEIHHDDKDHDYDNIEYILLPEDGREPAGVGVGIYDVYAVGALGILP